MADKPKPSTGKKINFCDDVTCPVTAIEGAAAEGAGVRKASCSTASCADQQSRTRANVNASIQDLDNILNKLTGLCKGATCYSSYMGSRPEKDQAGPKGPCGSSSCPKVKADPIASTEVEIKNASDPCGCGSTMCPFGSEWNDKYRKKFELPDLSALPRPTGSYGTNTYATVFEELNKSRQAITSSAAVAGEGGPCGGKPCPDKAPVEAGPCGGAPCPAADSPSKGNFCPKTTKASFVPGSLATGLGLSLGYLSRDLDSGPPVDGNCGGAICPYTSKDKSSPVPVGLCGRTSCPFASIEFASGGGYSGDMSLGTALCGQPTCPYSAAFGAQPSAPVTCGRPTCPYSNPSAPYGGSGQSPQGGGATCGSPTCPYSYGGGGQSPPGGGAPCGSPSCPYGLGGTQSTPYYSNDYGSVQNTVPPCPYMAPPPGPCGSPSCPFASVNKGPCGSPSCPYTSVQSPKKKPCSSSTCPYSSGAGGRRSSLAKGGGGGTCGDSACPFAYGDAALGGTCGDPTCQSTRRGSGMAGEAEGLGAGEEYEGESPYGDDGCTAKTCPYQKNLIICEECGGVVPDKDGNLGIDDSDAETTDAVRGSIMATTVSVVSGPVRKSMIASTDRDYTAPSDSESQPPEPDLVDLMLPEPPSVVGEDPEEKKRRKFKQKKDKVITKEPMYTYPGIQIGHKDCSQAGPRIPARMGWLWNVRPSGGGNVELWRGYKPGAVSRTVHKMIKAHREALGIIDPNELKKKKGKGGPKLKLEDMKRAVEIKKKDGDYIITVNPLKDPTTMAPFENPFVDCTPMQFKIERQRKPEKVKKPRSSACSCDASISDDESVDSSHHSELDFNFSPPAAIPDNKPKKKKVYNTLDTQYDKNDIPNEFKKGSKGGKGKGGKGGKGKKGKK